MAEPYVVAPPAGVRVRTRLPGTEDEAAVLRLVGEHLGPLAGGDLAQRCAEGRLDAQEAGASRRERKRELTALSSSRLAGAITRVSEDQWWRGMRNLVDQRRSLRRRVERISARLTLPAGEGKGRRRGYATAQERFAKQGRLQILQHRLEEVDERIQTGRVSIVRGGRRALHIRHHLEDAGLTVEEWRERWRACRLFLTADGEAGKKLGNETIRWDPDTGLVEVKLPVPLAHLANLPSGRWRMSTPVNFPYRGEEVAARARARQAIRYDVSFDPQRQRWYLDASWQTLSQVASLEALRQARMLSVDLNAGHFACTVCDPSGNPVGLPQTIPLELSGLSATVRDGRMQAAICQMLRIAREHGCAAIVIEDLDFADSREEGREHQERRPSRGKKGKRFRALVGGLPTAQLRHRIQEMAARQGISVIAVDPAYSTRWGKQHWLPILRISSASQATGHDAAALVLGRRGFGLRAWRRAPAPDVRCASRRPEDLQERAAGTTVLRAQAHQRDVGDQEARGQPLRRRRNQPAEQVSPALQVAQDLSGPPAGQDSLLLSVEERSDLV
jgi:IS605 OrfB family transposase